MSIYSCLSSTRHWRRTLMTSNLLGSIKRQLIRFTMVNFVFIFLTVVKGFYHSKLLIVTSTNFTFGLLDCHRYIGNIVLSKIVKSGFRPIFYCNFCRDIKYSSLHREYRYIEDRYIGVPLYKFNLGLIQKRDQHLRRRRYHGLTSPVFGEE